MFEPLREISECHYGPGDVLVVFGEVFSRGYVNGLIDAAKKKGMTVIYSTVGRRDAENHLRALDDQELEQKQSPLINIPLEAGFDLELSKKNQSPASQLEGTKLSNWLSAQLDFDQVQESFEVGQKRFSSSVKKYLKELEGHIPKSSHVLFVHTMAGGVPRAKIIMPAMNRVFKGFGERFQSSEEFWQSPLGRLCNLSFMEVTAQTFRQLIELSEPLRARQSGKQVSYVAYGYHGTEILINEGYRWQSYAPYLQGFAKLELEKIATEMFHKGISASVYNAPEILTNSSSIFLGVEVALYPLLGALKKEIPNHPKTKELLQKCQSLLKEDIDLDQVLKTASDYFSNPLIAEEWSQYEKWPQHNGAAQMALMREASTQILKAHRSEKELLTAVLSEIVFEACGKVMLCEGFKPKKPVMWIGHDLVARLTAQDF